jgi:hypothetical protein
VAGSFFGIGSPGAAKSLVAKATGDTARIPTIAFDLDAMQNAPVGASGKRLPAALKVVDTVTNGRGPWVATCNSIGTLLPEFRRRFTLGTSFFDLPSPEERATVWKICVAGYGMVVSDVLLSDVALYEGLRQNDAITFIHRIHGPANPWLSESASVGLSHFRTESDMASQCDTPRSVLLNSVGPRCPGRPTLGLGVKLPGAYSAVSSQPASLPRLTPVCCTRIGEREPESDVN